MSRLSEIIENHHSLDQLFAIIKHHGVNAEYVSTAILSQFEQRLEESEEDESQEEQTCSQAFIDDLKQFGARF
ncbi:hypothetical protein [Paenibacillus soyae]|uniref:Uncharacterized protein n=1 Tax=Paenibacillus soyae TaxID=2969249 RepID=A0A9X2S9H1_9BACL|nr:hypothetical protein [Paenibacillus soyae]MCR2802747.1 hypothetical protein [Paenibacillus soyae]